MSAWRVKAAGLVVLSAACYSVQAVPVTFITEKRPPVVYLSDGYGVVQTIANPRLSGDTVLGTAPENKIPLAVPLSQVERIRAVRFSRARTGFLVAGLTGIGILAIYSFSQDP